MNKIDKEIIDLIKKANYSIEENSALCLINTKFIGFHKKDTKTIVLCTNNAKKIGNFSNKRFAKNNDNLKTKIYLRRALRHEATHMAQACNSDNLTGMIKNINRKINNSKMKALNSSVKISGNLLKEVEAYVMEDRPKKVKKAIEKYCL